VLRIVVRTRPQQQWRVERELRRRIKLALDEAGIALPSA
jgi:small conductance mechanosensitive channel